MIIRETRIIMGMPVIIEIAGASAKKESFEELFLYFTSIDQRFSTYKDTSEISRINRHELCESEYSNEMREIFALAERTQKETAGFFDSRKPDGMIDPSGIVKGWAIQNASEMLLRRGHQNFYIDAGGDIQSHGKNSTGIEWAVGIRNPFNQKEVVKIIYPRGAGVATSGTYIRGQHIYNPHKFGEPITDIVSLTVIGPDICEADRFATAAFAMGQKGIFFIENLRGFEGYLIDVKGRATMTSGFRYYTTP